MNKLKIAVLTHNEGYAKALARGLAERTENTAVKAVYGSLPELSELADKLIDDGMIIVTDVCMQQKQQILLLTDKSSEEEGYNRICKFSRVSDILSKITRIYFELNDIEFAALNETDTVITGIFSDTGGCGATSFSIALGRAIALKSERPVLWLNAGARDDYAVYTGQITFETSKKEMLYLISEGEAWNLNKYCARDEYGLGFFRPEKLTNSLYDIKTLESLLAAVCAKQIFAHIVIDAGINGGIAHTCHQKLWLLSRRDKRTEIEKGTDGVRIYNFADEQAGDTAFCIPTDETSFEITGDNIRISPDGIFADSVSKIADMILEHDDCQA